MKLLSPQNRKITLLVLSGMVFWLGIVFIMAAVGAEKYDTAVQWFVITVLAFIQTLHLDIDG